MINPVREDPDSSWRHRAIQAETQLGELKKVNEALSRSTEGLSDIKDTSEILTLFLKEAIHVSGACSGAVLRRVGITEFEFAVIVQGDTILVGDELRRHPFFDGVKRASRLDPVGHFSRLIQGEIVWNLVGEDLNWAPEAIAYHRLHKQEAIWDIPFHIKGKVAGYLGLAFRSKEESSEIVQQTISSLAHQMALAIELSNLAEMAKEAAVLREQEISSKKRISELARTKQALERSVTSVSCSRDFTGTLSQIFVEIVNAADAASGYFFNYDALTNTLGTEFWTRDGTIHHGFDPDAAPILRQRFDADVTPAFHLYTQSRDIMVANHDEIDEATRRNAWPGVLDWHEKNGIKASCAIPLLAGDRPLGLIGLGWKEKHVFSKEEKQFLFALSSQASLVKELRKLADAESKTVRAQEQERATRERLEFLAKSNQALQETIDSLKSPEDLDRFVPAVLQITARTFGSSCCAYYEHLDGETVYLKYWFRNGELLRTSDLSRVDPDSPELLHRLVNGFTVPRIYLDGCSPGERKKSTVIDHLAGTSMPEFDEFAITNGWEYELNTPLLIGDHSDGALVIYRDRNSPFRESEILLAETLARQLALALQASRLSEVARDAAVARERALQLEQSNRNLQHRDRLLSCAAQITKKLLDSSNFEEALEGTLEALGRAAQISRVLMFSEKTVGNKKYHEVVREWCAENVPTHASLGLMQIPNESARQIISRLYAGQSFWSLIEDVEPSIQPAFRKLGIKSTGCVPIFISSVYTGTVAFDDCFDSRVWTEAEIDALTVAAQAIGAVLQRIKLSEKIAADREREAKQRVAKLAETNRVLKHTLDLLANEGRVEKSLGHVLKMLSEYLNSSSSAYWLLDDSSQTFRIRLVYHGGEILEATSLNSEQLKDAWPLNRDLNWKAHIESRRPLIYDVDTYSQISPLQKTFLDKLGVKTLLGIPLVLGSRIFGSFTIRFNEKRLFNDEEMELVQSLTHQATLACQLTQLAEENQQAAVLEERGRIAGEIHDSLAQAFTGISLQLEAALFSKAQGNDKVWNHVEMAKQLACFGLAEARSSVLTLRPHALDHGDLSATLKQLAQRTEIEGHLKCTFSEIGQAHELPAGLKQEAFRIVQEALGNALKHAKPQAITISLSYHSASIELTVQDDGAGFDRNRANANRGFGLIGMENRCKKWNGSFDIQSHAGRGTKVTVILPTKETP